MKLSMKSLKIATHVQRVMRSQDGDHAVLALLCAFSFRPAQISYLRKESEKYSSSLNNVSLSLSLSEMIYPPISMIKLFSMQKLSQPDVKIYHLSMKKNHLIPNISLILILLKFQNTVTVQNKPLLFKIPYFQRTLVIILKMLHLLMHLTVIII